MDHSPPPLPRQSSKKPKSSLLIVLAVIGMLVLAGGAFMLSQRFENRKKTEQAVDQMYDDINKLRAQTLETIESGELPQTAAQLNAGVEAMQRMANSATGKEREIVLAAASVLASLIDEAADYDNKWAAFMEPGGLDPTTLSSPDTTQQRIALLDIAIQSTIVLRDAYEKIPDEMIDAAKATGASDANVRSFERGVTQSMATYERAQKIFGHDIMIGHVMRDMLTLLHDRHDQWELEQGTGLLLFDADADADVYDKLYEEMDRLSVEQEALVRTQLTRPIGPR